MVLINIYLNIAWCILKLFSICVAIFIFNFIWWYRSIAMHRFELVISKDYINRKLRGNCINQTPCTYDIGTENDVTIDSIQTDIFLSKYLQFKRIQLCFMFNIRFHYQFTLFISKFSAINNVCVIRISCKQHVFV